MTRFAFAPLVIFKPSRGRAVCFVRSFEEQLHSSVYAATRLACDCNRESPADQQLAVGQLDAGRHRHQIELRLSFCE